MALLEKITTDHVKQDFYTINNVTIVYTLHHPEISYVQVSTTYRVKYLIKFFRSELFDKWCPFMWGRQFFNVP